MVLTTGGEEFFGGFGGGVTLRFVAFLLLAALGWVLLAFVEFGGVLAYDHFVVEDYLLLRWLLYLVLLLEGWAEVPDCAVVSCCALLDLSVLLEQLAELVRCVDLSVLFLRFLQCPLEARTVGCFDLFKALLQSLLLVCLILLRVYLFILVLFGMLEDFDW